MKNNLKKIIFVLTTGILFCNSLWADEGMWIPMLLEKLNIKIMHEKGLKLTAEDIYSINQASLKDAIVIFGRGCTGEVISDQGLLITNHHCGYDAIQSHSTLDHDYLTNGFWARTKDEELTNPGLTATFLVRMEDVTDQVLANITDNMDPESRAKRVKEAISKLQAQPLEDSNYRSIVKPFYYGNEYYMFVYKVYRDVRLVAAPPSAIGKFGGDTDNWMWPRHTGDFSVFRIYADKNNEPADYSPDNVPYKPKKHLSISLKGIKNGDFTMVFGYPGSTEEYLASPAVDYIINTSLPEKITLRQTRLDIMQKYMNADPAIRIKYAAKYANVSNAWKKWIGEIRGLKKLDALTKKKELEAAFITWAHSDPALDKVFGNVLSGFDSLYNVQEPYAYARDYFYETVNAVEMMKLVSYFNVVMEKKLQEPDKELPELYTNWLKDQVNSYYMDYYKPIDRETFAAMLNAYQEHVPQKFQPAYFSKVNSKYKGDFENYAAQLFRKSMFADSAEVVQLTGSIDIGMIKKIMKDPAYQLYAAFYNLFKDSISNRYTTTENQLDGLYRIYVKGLREMQPEKLFYPDANFTLRLTYGEVEGYNPYDAVHYEYQTTLKGVMEKDNPEIYDYDVPAKLKQLYTEKDYGRYGVDETMPVCFIASNHTSGGNSGSPVLNAEGQLIGLNFDRNWEGTMSDIMYDPDQCRNITVDIRYVLFLIDKYAGASNLINEMTIVE